jgi:uncharacterized membrane protein
MLNDFLYNIDPNTMLLALLFVIFFAIINFALFRMLKNKGTSSIISFCISLLAVYGINRTSLDINRLFNGIGIGDKLIYSVIPIIILAGLIYMLWNLGLGKTLMLTGVALVIVSFFVYMKTIILVIGIALFVVGLYLWVKGVRKERREWAMAPKVKNKLYLL